MQEFEISITREGKVRVHLHGVKGKQCMDVAEWLAQTIGPIQSTELTHEHYEPAEQVRLDTRTGRS